MREAAESEQISAEPKRANGAREVMLASAGIALLVLLVFIDLIIDQGMEIPSSKYGDTARYFVFSRPWGYAHILAGNFPLWNPHTFSGTPFAGVFQTSVLYPINLFHLVLPALNALLLEFILHLFLMGLFTFLWLRRWVLHPLGAFAGAVTVMFGASFMARVLAGQLTVIESFVWWPLLLYAIDRLSERATLGMTLLGVLSTSLIILAGHPPTALMAGIVTAAYCVPILVRCRHRSRLIGCLALIALWPILLSAPQLWVGVHTAAEGIRSEGMSWEFARSFSFPPENLLTLLAPWALGNEREFHVSFFGREFYWDAVAYIGILALTLAIHGAIYGRNPLRQRAALFSILITLTAMGGYTPIYRLLYFTIPGLSFIRAPSKFLFFATVFAAALVAVGVDRLLADREGARRMAIGSIALAFVLVLSACWTWLSPVASLDEFSPVALLASLNDGRRYEASDLLYWHGLLLQGLLIAASVSFLAAALWWLVARRTRGVLVLVLFVCLELTLFAYVNRGTTSAYLEIARRPNLMKAYRASGRSRVLEGDWPSNYALAIRSHALWGYDPVVLGRYAEFMTFTQGIRLTALERPTFLMPTKWNDLYTMLRARYHVLKDGEIVEHRGGLPQFLFVRDYQVKQSRNEVQRAIEKPDFDPRKVVILENEPTPRPSGRASTPAADRLQVLDSSTDHFDLEVELAEAAILVITDSYSNGWQASPLPGSSQREYQVLPANYVLRAIPLAAGHHVLRIEYAPLAFRAGVWAGGVSCVVFLAAATHCGYRSFKLRRRSERQA